jgi:AcrR family transcriptional regulator
MTPATRTNHTSAHSSSAQTGAPRTVGRPPAPAEEVAQRVLNIATEQYLRLGFSTVTTDETARAAGVSKKTLYQHFPSKEDLVREVVRRNCETRNADIRSICRDSGCSVIQRLRRMMNYLTKIFSELSPALVHDMRRSNPEVWQEVEKSRQQCVHQDFGSLLKEGRARGDFRKDIDPDVFMLIYAETARNVLNPEVFARLNLPPARVYETVSKVLFEGILTEKARKEPT